MAYAFNNDKSKFSLDGRILNWVKLSSHNESFTFSNTSTSSATVTYFFGTLANWKTAGEYWKNYDIIRVRFEISQMTYSIPSAKSVASSVKLMMSQDLSHSDTILDTSIVTTSSNTTFTISNKEYFEYMRTGAIVLDSDGTETYKYNIQSGTFAQSTLRPYLSVLYATNGTFTGRTVIEGASLYTL